MSTDIPAPPTQGAAAVLALLVGQEIPGGCDDCLAVQTVRRDPVHPQMWHLYVHHAESCPTYRAVTSG